LNEYLAPLFAKGSHEEHVLGTTEYSLMAIAMFGALIGIGVAYSKYIKQNQVPVADAEITGVSKILYNKYYVDEFYTALIVKPLNKLSTFFRKRVESAISDFVFGLGEISNSLGIAGKEIQTGSVGLYLFGFVIGVGAILFYLFLA
jgi:NADH-quinone oxidoreductase subunit L